MTGRPTWLLEAPKLILAGRSAFAVKLVRVGSEAGGLAGDYYQVLGPLVRGERVYVWIGNEWGEVITDPVEDVPPELTAEAGEALWTWLAWAEMGSDEDSIAPWASGTPV
ncbi:MAG TPA: hypothetical protein VHB02_03840 [Acidimicrobiales bacterium]|nr:hypothetical protein [Acidimicrobiales bacterium]